MKLIFLLLLLLPFCSKAQNRNVPAKQVFEVYDTVRRITVANVLGQMVYDQEYNTTVAEVNIDSLPAGFYLVKIIENHHTDSRHYYNNGSLSFIVKVTTGVIMRCLLPGTVI